MKTALNLHAFFVGVSSPLACINNINLINYIFDLAIFESKLTIKVFSIGEELVACRVIRHPVVWTVHVWQDELARILVAGGGKFGSLLVGTDPRILLTGAVRVFPLANRVATVVSGVCPPLHYRALVHIRLDVVWLAIHPICVGEFVFIVQTELRQNMR